MVCFHTIKKEDSKFKRFQFVCKQSNQPACRRSTRKGICTQATFEQKSLRTCDCVKELEHELYVHITSCTKISTIFVSFSQQKVSTYKKRILSLRNIVCIFPQYKIWPVRQCSDMQIRWRFSNNILCAYILFLYINNATLFKKL